MKVNYLLKSAFIAAFLFMIASVSATTYYVSDNGSNGDGLSEATAFTSLEHAVDVAVDGDVIVVVDKITTDAVEVGKFIKIEGKDGDAFITSTGSDRILNVNLPEGSSFLWIEGVTFSDGSTDGNGGAVNVSAGRVHFTDCFFENNSTMDGGGAIYGEGDAVVLEFYNCTFIGNYAEKNGGAIRVARGGGDFGPTLVLDYCIIQGNSSINRGAAMSLEGPKSVHMYATIVDNNKTTSEGTGGIRITGASFPFYAEACSFSRNLGYGDHGGFMIIDGDPKTVTMVNSTITGNINGARTAPGEEDSRPEGGAGCIWATGDGMVGTVITLVNVTMSNNTSGYGANGNNGSGWTFQNAGYVFRVYNSLIVGNVAGGASANGAVDISYRANASEFTVKNSIIGCVYDAQQGAWNDTSTWFPAGVPWTISDEGTGKSKIQEYEYTTNGGWPALDESGLYLEDGGAYKTKKGSYYYTFNEGAYATTLGAASLLTDGESWETDKDQFLQTRDVASGTVWAGAIEGLYGEGTQNDIKVVADPVQWTSIKQITPATNEIKMNTLVEKDGYININFGSYAGHAKAELISINGQVVKTLINNQINGKYPCNVSGVASGIYFIKVTLDSGVVTKKVVIK